MGRILRRLSFGRLRWPLLVLVMAAPLLFTGCNGTLLTPGTLVEQLIIGLILGSVYALIALGYTLVYGVIKLINFAHGDIYMVGAFLGYYGLRFFIRWLNYTHGTSLIICFALSVLMSAVLCAVLAVVMERLAYRPLRNSSRIAALITAVGVSFLLENLGIIAFGANPKSYEPKTLAVYQVQTAATPAFASAHLRELTETAQYTFPAAKLTAPLYARVRLVAKTGVSAWSPVLELSPQKASAYIDAPGVTGEATGQPATRAGPTSPRTIGYTTRKQRGHELVTISWEEGTSADVALNPVFSTPDGQRLAFELPLRTSGGGRIRVPYFNVVIVVLTLLVLVLLNTLINRSMFGISMRALSFDLNAAKLMGVNTDAVIAWTFAIGGACAALAGNMVGLYNQTLEPLMGILPGLKAFVAAVFGGIGSIPGAAAGGLIMGVSEALVKTFIPEGYSKLADAFAFALLIVVLLVRPSGLFGRTVKEKV